MRKFLLPFLFIFLIIGGCVRNRQYNIISPTQNVFEGVIYIDSKFSSHQEELIKGAISAWECSTKGIVKLIVIDNYQFNTPIDTRHSLVIMKVHPETEEIIDADTYTRVADNQHPSDGKPRFVIGLYIGPEEHQSARIMIVDDRINDNDYSGLVRHELGHSFSMDHSETTDSIMFRHLDLGSRTITQNDLGAFCSIYNCDADKLESCD